MIKQIRSYRISIALILLAALAAGPFLSIKADPVRAASRSTNTQAPTGIGNTLCSLSKHGTSPILSPGSPGAWDSGAVWNPAVLKIGTGYKMWFNGGNGSVTSIGYATSPDGITWTKYPVNPVLAPSDYWEGTRVFAPAVLFEGGTYKMWYSARDDYGTVSIGYATSPDGISWTKSLSNPVLYAGNYGLWDDVSVFDPTIVNDSGTYHLWYSGFDGTASRIGHATSVNGVTWSKDASNPALDVGAPGSWDWLDAYAPNAVLDSGEYYLLYSGGTLPEKYQIGSALSSDGRRWQRQGVLIPQGGRGAFDEFGADYPSGLLDGSTFKIWYSGYSSAGIYTIGYASAGLCPLGAPGDKSVFLPLTVHGENCQAPYYADNFSDPNSGWITYEDSYYKFGYTGGEYQLQLKFSDDGNAVTPGALAVDFTALVSMRRVNGDGEVGMVFGINEDWSEFYEVAVRGNQYSIWIYNGGWSKIKDWAASPAIHSSGANQLKVVRSGSNISVYANNTFLTTISNGSFTGLRRIGVMVVSYDQPTEGRFDNFAMYPAGCGSIAASLLSRQAASIDSAQLPSLLPDSLPRLPFGWENKKKPSFGDLRQK